MATMLVYQINSLGVELFSGSMNENTLFMIYHLLLPFIIWLSPPADRINHLLDYYFLHNLSIKPPFLPPFRHLLIFKSLTNCEF